jgi:hypothetical protein
MAINTGKNHSGLNKYVISFASMFFKMASKTHPYIGGYAHIA